LRINRRFDNTDQFKAWSLFPEIAIPAAANLKEYRMKISVWAIVLTATFLLALTPGGGVQAQARRTGAITDQAAYEKVPYKSNLVRGLSMLPSRASVKQYAPYSNDQGDYGTCTGWACAYSATTIIYAKLNGLTDRDKITRSAFSPGFAYRESFAEKFIGCTNPQVISYVLSAIKEKGVPFFSDLDSLCPATISTDSFEKARSFSILGYTRLAAPNDNKTVLVQKVKKMVSEMKPVVVCFYVDDAPQKGCFYNINRDFIWIPDRSVKPVAGHAMTVVGYDDSYGGGAFEVQNSWGRSWGNDGFFWMRYSDFADYAREAYELLENPEMVNPEGAQLSGALTIQKSDGHSPEVRWNGSMYVVQEDFPSRTRFRLYLDNNEPAFVYLVGVDTAWKTYRLFPSNESMSPALTYKRNQVALPGEDLYIQTDKNPGEERIVVLYSLHELDLKAIENALQNESGTIAMRLNALLGNALVPFDQVAYEKNTMTFKAKGRTNGVVALLVSINHTP